MRTGKWCLSPFFLLALAVAAHAQPPAQDCASITDAAARLACYDARAKEPAPAQPAPEQPAPAQPATPAPSAAPDANQDAFGKPWQEHVEEMSAHLAYPIADLQKGSLLTLDNGQAWKCLYAPLGYYQPIAAGTEVTVRKDFFGGFRLKIGTYEGELKVKRLR